jgi:hypothetical protein
VDRFEVAQYEIGQKVQQIDMAAFQMFRQIRMLSFADLAFAQDEPLYKPEEVRGMEPDISYIHFRTAEEKPAEQTLQEARPEVVNFWKKRKAYELAVADAKKLAEQAKGATSLTAVVPEPNQVIMPPAFSWMTTGGLGFGAPELSQVQGIGLAGQEFMQAVFALQLNETGAAPDQAHSTVYVVRVTGQDPDDEQLRTRFLESGYNQLVLMLAQREALFTSVEWYRGVAERYQVTWQRPPNADRRM